MAEKHYREGLAHFGVADYQAAEKAFSAALRLYAEDARYYYYFGLSLWQQGKRDYARESFRKGSVYEGQAKPPSATVNVALERIQGSLRMALNKEREQPRVAKPPPD